MCGYKCGYTPHIIDIGRQLFRYCSACFVCARNDAGRGMKPLSINLTRRSRRRRLRSGSVVTQERYVLNFNDPKNGHRHQLFFERKAEALSKRDDLLRSYSVGVAAMSADRQALTVAQAVKRWLSDRESEVTRRTMQGYVATAQYIVGPIISGSSEDRFRHALAKRAGRKSQASEVQLIGHMRVADLATSDIRTWYKTVAGQVGVYTASRAKMFLAAALALAAEDFDLRPPAMPRLLRKGRPKARKTVLKPAEVTRLLQAARADAERGIYYAFPFLTGVRPSEQLGLLWSEIDFADDQIRIRRIQDECNLVEMTKTAAGMRDIPMAPLLREMLLDWRERCPRRLGQLHRVFPGPGRGEAWPRQSEPGGPLHYQNFRKRYWRPAFAKLGLPYVTPHSARHSFISTLQMLGFEVGLVAKLAGHANPMVTLSHYTQAMRGGDQAVNALQLSYGVKGHEAEERHG